MNVLLVDTSGPVCGVAVASGNSLLYEAWVINKKTHSQKIMPMVDAAMQMLDLTVSDMDAFAAVVGPGSFTGVRIGVSTAKGLAEAAGKPCLAVDGLEALANNVPAFDGVICPILDARAGQVYGAIFRGNGLNKAERLYEDEALKLEEFLGKVAVCDQPALFLGDGMPVHREKIQSILGGRAQFAPSEHAQLRPGTACMLAAANLEQGTGLMSADQLLPLYLRAPQAERERAARQKAEAAADVRS